MTLQELRDAFPGYHVTISMWPTGGEIELSGCDECGGVDGARHSAIWYEAPKQSPVDALIGGQRSLAQAVSDLQKMGRSATP